MHIQKSKLVQHIVALSGKEHRRWHRYVLRSYEDPSLHMLSAYLLSLRPRWNSEDLREDYIFQLAFPDTAFSVNQLRKLMTKLLQSLTDFWVVEAALEDPSYRNQIIRKNYLEKELYKFYQKETTKRVQQLETQASTDTTELYELHQIHQEWAFEYTNLSKVDPARIRDTALDYLGLSSTIQSIKYLNAYLVSGTLAFQLPEYLNIFHQHLDKLRALWPNHPEIQCHFHISDINKDPSHANKLKAFEYLKIHKDNISKDSLYICMVTLVRTHLSPDAQEKQLLLDIIEWGLSSKFLYNNDKADYSAIFRLAAELARKGDVAYSNALNETTFGPKMNQTQFDFYYLLKGYILFIDHEYGQSLEAMKEIGFIKVPAFELNKRTIEIYNYFYLSPEDSHYIDLIENSLANFYKYVKRYDGLAPKVRKRELCKLDILKLFNLNISSIDTKTYERLEQKIKQTDELYGNSETNLLAILDFLKKQNT